MTPDGQDPDVPRPPMRVVPRPDSSEDDGLEAVATSLESVASVMDQLTGQLSQLTEAFGHTRTLRSTETEIGRLFLQAQAYVDESVGIAEVRARAIVSEAEVQAARIVTQANEEAAAIVERARRDAILRPEAVARLSSTIEGFSRMNDELVRELSMLRASLTPMEVQAPPPAPSTRASTGSEGRPAPDPSARPYPFDPAMPGRSESPGGNEQGRLAG